MIDKVLEFLCRCETILDIAQDTGFDLQRLDESTSFGVELGADDLDLLLLSMDIEDEFNVAISDAEILELTSPAAVARLLGMKL